MTTIAEPVLLDYTVVRALHAEVAARISAERRRREQAGGSLSRDEEPRLGRTLIAEALGHPEGDLGPDAELAAAVHDEMFGAGRLQRIIDDPRVINIDVNGADHVEVTLYGAEGKWLALPVADDDDELIRLVRRVATYGDPLSAPPFDEAHPNVVLDLPGGHRLSATSWVCRPTSLSVRCVRPETKTLADLRDLGLFSDEVGAFLEAAVRARMNLIVSGGTLSGKTTLVRALTVAIPPGERIFTFENFRELGLKARREQGEVVEMKARPANSEGAGEVSIGDLIRMARQQNPGRLIVGEVNDGRDVRAMLSAMTQGENGSLSSVHANSARMVFRRLATYASEAGLPVQTCYDYVAGALDFIVHIATTHHSDGTPRDRFIGEVLEVVGYDGSQVVASEVFTADQPRVPQQLVGQVTSGRAARLAAAGYDPRSWRVS